MRPFSTAAHNTGYEHLGLTEENPLITLYSLYHTRLSYKTTEQIVTLVYYTFSVECQGTMSRRSLENQLSTSPGLQYHVRPVTRATELKPGDHIRENCWIFDHHLLVVRVLSDTQALVLHYTSPRFHCERPPSVPAIGVVAEEVREINSRKYPVSVLTFRDAPNTVYTAEEAFERMRTRLGERRWELFTNNCEHLVNWALTGVTHSSQLDAVKEVGKGSVETAVKVWILFVPLLGVLLSFVAGVVGGLANAAASYLLFRCSVNENEQALREGNNRTRRSSFE